ncbi:hypothetical protein, partial [Leifsonia sp. TF02-11]|uniref:hypothetical protein n=1 Tax=Leifsonia sp. TF02-11 TaxID=2815212 RepID=UPI001AA1A565
MSSRIESGWMSCSCAFGNRVATASPRRHGAKIDIQPSRLLVVEDRIGLDVDLRARQLRRESRVLPL